MFDRNEIVYSINIEDIQTVAINELGRKLTEDEIEKIKNLISEKVNWYDAILYSIIENEGIVTARSSKIKNGPN